MNSITVAIALVVIYGSLGVCEEGEDSEGEANEGKVEEVEEEDSGKEGNGAASPEGNGELSDAPDAQHETTEAPYVFNRLNYVHCKEKLGNVYSKHGKRLLVFEVLPGVGWDILRNLEMSRVLELDYSECLTTTDMEYLIPGGINMIPIKASSYQEAGKSIEHFSDYSSQTSFTLDAEASVPGIVTGSLGMEKQKVKKDQVSYKSSMRQYTARHRRYKINMQPGAKLDRNFRRRLLQIADVFLSVPTPRADEEGTNKTQQEKQFVKDVLVFQEIFSDYLSELIIRDYGTHFIKYVEAGALISELVHTQESSSTSTRSEKSAFNMQLQVTIKTPTPVEVKLGMKASFSKTQQQTVGKMQKNSMSKLSVFGGPPYNLGGPIEPWLQNLDNNLVPIDRSGDNIYNLVNKGTFPTLPAPIVYHMRDSLKRATDRYYERNSAPGCMDFLSPSFDPKATVSDPSRCMGKPYSFSQPFGGFYILSQASWSSRKNPVTDDYNCAPGSRSHKHLLPQQDGLHTLIYCVYPPTNTNADYYLRKNRGALFGGAFSKSNGIPNQITRRWECPDSFQPHLLFSDAYMCIAFHQKTNAVKSFVFGGLSALKIGDKTRTETHKCPASYSHQILTTLGGYEWAFCYKDAAFINKAGSIDLKLPPYTQLNPKEFVKNLQKLDSINLILYGEEGSESRRWTKVNGVWKQTTKFDEGKREVSDSSRAGETTEMGRE